MVVELQSIAVFDFLLTLVVSLVTVSFYRVFHCFCHYSVGWPQSPSAQELASGNLLRLGCGGEHCLDDVTRMACPNGLDCVL